MGRSKETTLNPNINMAAKEPLVNGNNAASPINSRVVWRPIYPPFILSVYPVHGETDFNGRSMVAHLLPPVYGREHGVYILRHFD